MRMSNKFFQNIAIGILFLSSNVPVSAQTLTILHSFGDGSVQNDGSNPNAGPIQGRDGNFYATTTYGGSANCGTIFKFTSSGVVTILHSFNDGSINGDGVHPWGGLVQSENGDLSGTPTGGGPNGSSAVMYTLSPNGSYSATSSPQAGNLSVSSLIIGQDGNFYGTTYSGGTAGNGTIFKMTPDFVLTILHSFGDGSVSNDGANPTAPLMQYSDGNFYGTTLNGGMYGDGTAFRMSPSGSITILHAFGATVTDGISPWVGLVDGGDGYLYGSTTAGGENGSGILYRMDTAGSGTILHSFQDGSVSNDGSYGNGLFHSKDGNFYGTTKSGGAGGSGTIFSMTPTGKVTILHSFNDGSVHNDGVIPCTTLTQALDGNLYGTTFVGGSADQGTIYRLTLPQSDNPIAIFPSGLHLFSLPYTFTTPLDSLFGYSGVNLAQWSPDNSDYLLTVNNQLEQIAIGQGYWARFPQQVLITANGTPADTTQNFNIDLLPGWNMIGDPFTTVVPISSLLLDEGSQTFAQASSGQNPLIGPTVWEYSQSTNTYTPATSLVPGLGYWICAFTNANLQVPHP